MKNGNVNVVTCPPCGESTAKSGVRGAYKATSLISPSIGPADHFLRKGGRKGFTLIELLVVVLIISILAAVAVPQYQRAVYKSHFATLQPLVHALANAAESYYLANGEYPTQFNELDIDLPETPTSADTEPDEHGLFSVYFPWGLCLVRNNAYNKFISCTKSNISYTEFSTHSAQTTGKRVCSAMNGDTAAYDTCKAMTGNNPYYSDPENSAFYFD